MSIKHLKLRTPGHTTLDTLTLPQNILHLFNILHETMVRQLCIRNHGCIIQPLQKVVAYQEGMIILGIQPRPGLLQQLLWAATQNSDLTQYFMWMTHSVIDQNLQSGGGMTST